MLPPPPVLAPPLGAADAAALDDTSGVGAVGVAVAVAELGTGAGLDGVVLDGAGVDGAVLDGAGLDGAGLEGAGLDGDGVVVQVGVGVGVGLWQWWHVPVGDGDGDRLWPQSPPPPPPGCPLSPAVEAPDSGVACAAVAPSSSIPTPRAKLQARIRMRWGISRSFSLDHSLRSFRVRQAKQGA